MKLVTWRKEQGLSQRELARKLNTARISIIRYEAGQMPERSIMERVIEVTGGAVTPNDFFGEPLAPSAAHAAE